MELIKLLDVANPKLIKDTLNRVSQDYETFRTEIEEIANTALNTAVTANDTANTALTTVIDYEAVVMESAQDSSSARLIAEEALAMITQADERSQEAALLAERSFTEASEAVQTSELAMNVANEAKSTVDQALDIGTLGSFVHNVNGIALAHAHMTDDPNQADDEELSYLATPTLVREAVKDKADRNNSAQLITAGGLIVPYTSGYTSGYIQFKASSTRMTYLGISSAGEFYVRGYNGAPCDANIYGSLNVQSTLSTTGTLSFHGLDGTARRIILDMVHPVNSIIEIEDDTFDPNVYYAGTDSVWERLPDGYVLWSASSGAGETIAAGLPNITGEYVVPNQFTTHDNPTVSGAITAINGDTEYYINIASAPARRIKGFSFNANNSNSIYRDDINTVQPPARKTCMWKRTA